MRHSLTVCVGGVFSLVLLSGCPSSTGPDLVGCACMCTISGSFATTPAIFPVGRACGVGTGSSQNVPAACDRICRAKSSVCILPPCPDPMTCSSLTSSAGPGLSPTPGTFVANGCTGAAGGPPTPEGGDPGRTSAIVLPGSTLTIDGVGVAVTGTVEATVGGGTIVLADVVLDAPGPEVIDGKTIRSGRAYLSEPVFGTFTTPSHFSIPANGARILLNARVDGSQIALRATNTSPLTGDYVEAGGQFTLSGTIEDVDGTTAADVDLVLAFQNLPPKARITALDAVECDSPGVATAHVSAAGSTDPNGADDMVHFLWILDRGTAAEVAFSGIEVDLPLPLGQHEIQLFVTDRSGATSGAAHSVNAVDTTGPVLEGLTVTPACLWPPNHKLAHYKVGREIQFVARDRCHPGSETVRVISTTSSEPADGTGDGHTQPDSVVTSDGFCVRSERSGQSSDGRTYVVQFEAVDAIGNRSQTTASVMSGVAHDQRGSSCGETGIELVDDGDPVCAPAVAPAVAPPPVARASCTALPASAMIGLLLLIPGIGRSRSRRSC